MANAKRIISLKAKVDRAKLYPLKEAAGLVKENATAKFDETIELHAKLGVDPRKGDQQVRGTTVLPHGTGRKVTVLVFAKGDKEKEAQQAGADFVGSDDLVEKITGGWAEFDVAIATPDMMKDIGKLGRILKSRLPNPKSGTVTMNIAQAVKEAKAGRVEYRVDSYGIVHAPVGKASFAQEQIADNARTLIQALLAAKPSAAKGTYMKTLYLTSTMGPGVRIDPAETKEKE